MFRMTMAFVLAGTLAAARPAPASPGGIEFFVSPGGSDKASGSAAKAAFATPARGLKAVAEARAKGLKCTITVHLLAGDYVLAEPLAIGREHCDADGGPTRIVGAPGPVPARLLGGTKLTGFAPLAKDSPLRRRIPAGVADKVVQVNLRALGITDPAPLVQCGFGIARQAGHSQLYVNGTAMPLAGWPNDGGFAKIADGIDARTMRTAQSRPGRWASIDGAWAYGYWYHDWADSYHPITAYDRKAGTVTLGGAKPPVYGFRKGRRYRFLNVPEELDSPGEWYIDAGAGTLVMLPPAGVDLAKADVLLSQLGKAMVTLKDASHVRLERLIIEAGRGGGVRIDSGTHNLVYGCILRCLGKPAVVIEGGSKGAVISCLLYNLAEGGMALSGGDRKTLTPAGHGALNCDIHDFGQWCKTYQPAVRLAGVGQMVHACHIHRAPHAGILLSGNDHEITECEIDHVALETGDVGAIYLGRDWTFRGNAVIDNHFHDIGGVGMGAMGVYNDDCASGTLVRGNLFERVSRALMIGGGRDIVARNNIFVDCVPAVHVDGRGLIWKQPKDPKRYPSWDLVGKLRALPYDKPPWSTKYHNLAKILDEDPWAPAGNEFEVNIVLGGRLQDVRKEALPFFKPQVNLVFEKPSEELRKAILAVPARHLAGFNPLRTEHMGLDAKALKAALPGADAEK
ncbi:MAG: right-handed parallel beta-helix repeat-containing protein [Phycisphaerae bacterium]|nr:right-handed parallel beta-helix repeat-containing protein [Phycisphaerae bacterium]